MAGLTIYPRFGLARVKLEPGHALPGEDGTMRSADGLRRWATILTSVAVELDAAEARDGDTLFGEQLPQPEGAEPA